MPGRVLFTLLAVAAALVVAPAGAAAYSIDPQAHVSETSGSVTYTIHRTLGEPDDPSVTLAGSGAAPATAGADVGTPQLKPFAPTSMLTTVTVPIVNDAADEPAEAFTITVAASTAQSAQTTTTIDDDDITVDVSAPAGTPEGGTATVTLTPRAASAREVRVDYATSPGTAAATGDFAPAHGSVTWPAGDTSPRTVSVATAQDALDEDDETLGLLVASPADALSAPAVALTIADDDPLPLVGAVAARVTEGDSGTTAVRVLVALSRPSGRTVRVPYSTRSGTATARADFATTSGTLTFAPGETGKAVDLVVKADRTREPDETFTLALGTPENAAPAANATDATITIADDDGGGAPAADGGDLTPPRLRLGPLRASASRVTLTVRCPAAERTCRGALALFNVPRRHAAVRPLRAERRLARTTYRLAGGRTRRVTLRLSAATRRLLRRARAVRVRAYAVTTDAAGNLATTSRGATLRFG